MRMGCQNGKTQRGPKVTFSSTRSFWRAPRPPQRPWRSVSSPTVPGVNYFGKCPRSIQPTPPKLWMEPAYDGIGHIWNVRAKLNACYSTMVMMCRAFF